ncbi:gamma-glutamyltransferase [Kytococcus sp. CUA-901]|nr:gamma-glutamyltransferase [Kytococcus sp. CUA-901]
MSDPTFTTRPTLEGTFGMVSSTHWTASSVAMRMLELGGNAFDAAVAGGFALHVVEPHLNGPGGDLPAIVHVAGEPRPRVLCGQGPAPAGATPEAFGDLGLEDIPGSGPTPAAVPGAVDAWLLMLQDLGSLDLRTVLAPAIDLARQGVPLVARVGDTIRTVADLFTLWPGSAELWMPDGAPPQAGQVHSNPAWADTLERLVEEAEGRGGDREATIQAARDVWARGFVAEAIGAFMADEVPMPEGESHPWLLSVEDLNSYEATWEEPVISEWNGYEVAKTGPWGQGPVMLEALGMLESLGGELDVDTAEGVHRIVEALKLAFADREAWYGDSAPVPIDDLLSPAYLRERAGLIGDRADHELRPGSPGGHEPRLPEAALGSRDPSGSGAGAGEPTVDATGRTRGDTCHIDVVDRLGNMVTATPSGGWLQSSPTIPALGMALGTRLQMMRLEPGLPSSLVPGRRPRTTLTPTLVLRDGEPVLACGSPGGDQQDQWQLVFLLRHLLAGQTLQEAIDAPTFHTLSMPGSFWPRTMEPGVVVVEGRCPPEVVSALEELGHEVRVGGAWSLGRMCAVSRNPRTGVLSAGANPRGMQGYAVGR